MLRLRFGLRTLLLFVPVVGLAAAWVGRSEQQRLAAAAIRKLYEHECVFYSFDHEGCCAGNGPRRFQPGWLSESIGFDYFYNVTNVFVKEEKVDVALPLLKRLPGLKEIWVIKGDGEDYGGPK